jgi:CelD/BcsL family acetyltransferase involved in cellulose biosynthesis
MVVAATEIEEAARPGSAPPRAAHLVLTDEGALDRIEDTWRALWARTVPAPPMLEYRWVQTWWRLHRGEGRLLLLLVVDDQRQPLGLAPLYLRDEGVAHPSRCLRTVRFLGTGESEGDEVAGEYTTWLGAPEALATVTAGVAAQLAAARPVWDRLYLNWMWPGAGIEDGLSRALAGKAIKTEIVTTPSFRAPVRPLAEYLKALSSGNFRHRCRRALRAGQDQGVELVRAQSAPQAQQMFEQLMVLHQHRWQRRGEPGVFASPVFTGFQKALLEPYRTSGAAWLVGLRQKERWLAVRYLLCAGGRLYDYLSGVDTEVNTALAPGLLLHLLTIDAAAEAGLVVYDLMAGDADFKRHLTTEETALPTIDLFARTPRARLWLAARELTRRYRDLRERAAGRGDGNGASDAPAAAAGPPAEV